MKPVVSNNPLRFYTLSAIFAALTAVSAYFKIPLPYVPITLQTYFVLLSGTLLRPKYSAFSQILYLTIGLVGAPVFAHGGGPAYIFQPTFGYLLSYPIAAYIISHLTHFKIKEEHSQPSDVHVAAACCVGVLIILILGAGVLYLNLKHIVHKPVSLGTLFVSYFLIFVPGDMIKIILAVLTTKKLYRLQLL